MRPGVRSVILDGEMMVVNLATGRFHSFGDNRSHKAFAKTERELGLRHCFFSRRM